MSVCPLNTSCPLFSKYGLDHNFLDVDFNIFGLEVIGLLTFFRFKIVNLLFRKLLLSLCTSLLNFQAGSMDLVDGWYQHLVPLLSCLHHVVENYRQFFLYFCAAKSSSTNNRRRFDVATPLWGKCEVATHTPENGTWESSGTPKNSKRDCKGQNT